MDLLTTVVMGVVQGATEFLPVSSSGHLRLAEALFEVQEPDMLFDIMLHVGTLVAVCLVYRQDLLRLVRDSWRALMTLVTERSIRAALRPEGARLALMVGIATVPTGLIGVSLDKLIDGPSITTALVGVLLVVNGGVLLSSRFARDPAPPDEARPRSALSLWGLTPAKAVLIGIAQGVAVLPGISRSGLTITTALYLKVDRLNAARYSFLMSIPAILGALVLKFDPSLFIDADPDRLIQYALGTTVSAVVGFGCLTLLLHLLRRAQFHHFAWYSFAMGLVALTVGLELL